MTGVQRFNAIYYRWFYWLMVLITIFVVVVVVASFIDEPKFTLKTVEEFLFMAVAVTYCARFTVERRQYLRDGRMPYG